MVPLMRGLFASCLGMWLSGMLWLMTRNPWVGVFVVGFCLGLFLLENWALDEELRRSRENVIDLEKQVVGLRSIVSKMVLGTATMEVESRRSKFRSSTSSDYCQKRHLDNRLDPRSSSF